MTFDEAIKTKELLETLVNNCSAYLGKFPRNSIGITPDEIKERPEWKQAKNDYDLQFKRLQEINQFIIKNYKKEYFELKRSARSKVITRLAGESPAKYEGGNLMTMPNGKTVVFLAYNKTFNSFTDAYNYCLSCDFDPEEIKIKEEN